MRPIVTDGVAWSVCLSVGWSFCHNLEPCKNGWTDRDAIWGVDSGWPREPRIRWGPDPPCERAILRGKTLSARQMVGWKSKINNRTESELWRNAGSNAFHLPETVLKSDKIRCAYLVINCISLQTFWMPLIYSLILYVVRCCYVAASMLTAMIQSEPRSASFPSFFFLQLFHKRTFEDKWQRLFYLPDDLPVTQPAVSKQWRKHKALWPGLVISSSTTESWWKGRCCLGAW